MKKQLVLLIFVANLAGCYDEFYGPKFRNEYPSEIKVVVTYKSGNSQSFLWPTCRAVFLGKKDDSIKVITAEHDGRIVSQLDSPSLDSIAEKDASNPGRYVWVLDEKGVHQSRDADCSLKMKTE